MTDLTHRNLVSAIISLASPPQGNYTSHLYDRGYRVNAIEPPMIDRRGERFTPDLHLVAISRNASLLIDCKTGPIDDHGKQLKCYLSVGGQDIVAAGKLTLTEPGDHILDSAFFVTAAAESSVTMEITSVYSSGFSTICGFGLFRVGEYVIELCHDELTDHQLSSSSRTGWNINLLDLPLELLPWEVTSPTFELAHVLFQTIGSFNAIGQQCFSLDELCVESHPFWEYLGDQQPLVRKRIRRMMMNLRRTALKDWIQKQPNTDPPEEHWCFKRRPSVRQGSLDAFARRGERYIELLRSGANPRPHDFDDVDQILLPIPS